MKQYAALLLILCLLTGLCACSRQTFQEPGNYYYDCSKSGDSKNTAVIAPEQHELSGIRDDPAAIMADYLSGPRSADLESPFPRDTALLHWEIRNEILYLQFNEAFGTLSGIDLTIACACLTQTCLELFPVNEITVSARGTLLGGSNAITLNRENLHFSDNGIQLLHPVYTVYYTDSRRRYLIAQEIELALTPEEDLITALVECLTDPPDNSGLYVAVPLRTEVLGVTVEDGLCSINLSAEFESRGWNYFEAQRLTLMSIVNTLTQLEEVDRVEFYVEGNLLVQYRTVSIPQPLQWDASVIGPVRTGVNEFDATIYLRNNSDQYLVPVPTRIQHTAGITPAEQVVEALLTYPAGNGLESPIPGGTMLHSVTTENGVCVIDLSKQFLSDPGRLPQAVHSIIGSVCALDGIDAARITVNGAAPEGELASYFQLLTPESDWFI